MKILKYAVLSLLALFGVLTVVGLCMPKEWSVERSVVVNADAGRIHAVVGNLESGPKWMPWFAEDPAIQVTFEGTAGQPGSAMIWTSEKLGNGRLTLLKSDVASGLDYDVTMEEMSEPVHGTIRYAAEGGGTRVTWHDFGALGGNPFVRLFGPVMEGMMGHYLDQGLANVKAAAEKG